MRKSEALTRILQNMDIVEYDESFTELDRDRLKLGFLSDFTQELQGLLISLKSHPGMLPNHKKLLAADQPAFDAILKGLEKRIDQLKIIQKHRAVGKIASAIGQVHQSCTACHQHFRDH